MRFRRFVRNRARSTFPWSKKRAKCGIRKAKKTIHSQNENENFRGRFIIDRRWIGNFSIRENPLLSGPDWWIDRYIHSDNYSVTRSDYASFSHDTCLDEGIFFSDRRLCLCAFHLFVLLFVSVILFRWKRVRSSDRIVRSVHLLLTNARALVLRPFELNLYVHKKIEIAYYTGRAIFTKTARSSVWSKIVLLSRDVMQQRL